MGHSTKTSDLEVVRLIRVRDPIAAISMDLEVSNVEIVPIPNELIAASLNEASRKYVFSSYRTYHQLQSSSHLHHQEYASISINDLRSKSVSFRDDLGVFISELLLIENSMQDDVSHQSKILLTKRIDIIIEFTRLFHLTEILCLQVTNDGENPGYYNVLRWLQDLSKKISSPLDDEDSAIAFQAHILPETLFPEYWSVITLFVTQGKLLDAANLIFGHSELKSASKSDSENLYAVFTTHPLANALADESENVGPGNFRMITNDWASWRFFSFILLVSSLFGSIFCFTFYHVLLILTMYNHTF